MFSKVANRIIAGINHSHSDESLCSSGRTSTSDRPPLSPSKYSSSKNKSTSKSKSKRLTCRRISEPFCMQVNPVNSARLKKHASIEFCTYATTYTTTFNNTQNNESLLPSRGDKPQRRLSRDMSNIPSLEAVNEPLSLDTRRQFRSEDNLIGRRSASGSTSSSGQGSKKGDGHLQSASLGLKPCLKSMGIRGERVKKRVLFFEKRKKRKGAKKKPGQLNITPSPRHLSPMLSLPLTPPLTPTFAPLFAPPFSPPFSPPLSPGGFSSVTTPEALQSSCGTQPKPQRDRTRFITFIIDYSITCLLLKYFNLCYVLSSALKLIVRLYFK